MIKNFLYTLIFIFCGVLLSLKDSVEIMLLFGGVTLILALFLGA